jgi:hypothetical protein
MNLGVIFGVLGEALKLWNSKEASKYIDQMLKLKARYYEEYSKPPNIRSDVALDAIELHLKHLCEAFVNATQSKDSQNK